MIKIALTGNPNAGKSTLFNLLTGAKQKTGNWPGVTVEQKFGWLTYEGEPIEIVDLPGTYSLTADTDKIALDQKIALDFLLSIPTQNEALEKNSHIIVNVIDATHIERHLFLTTELLELNIPVIIALNMSDRARKKGIHINIKALSDRLGCPIIPISAYKKTGINELLSCIKGTANTWSEKKFNPITHYPPMIESALKELQQASNSILSRCKALQCLEGPIEKEDFKKISIENKTNHETLWVLSQQLKTTIQEHFKDDLDIIIADQRYQLIDEIVKNTVSLEKRNHSISEKIDRLVLNRYAGIPIFLCVMYALFFFSINIGGALQDFFDIASDTLFVQGLSNVLSQAGFPLWLNALLTAGVGKGLNTTVTFIPVIGAMFFFVSLLEASGYMTRAAFVVDRIMRAIGLPGKSFVPLIVGFGCNVPAIMATRILKNRRDRILTILMSPFMSCGARLAIYAIFTAAFFPSGGQNIVFCLYLIGILMAVLTGFILRHTLLKGSITQQIMEMPSYHLPSIKSLALQTWQRLKQFIFKAGKVIIPVCVLIGGLNAITLNGSINQGHEQESVLAYVGKKITPIFEPMGIHQNNWPATVGLLTGTLAKEVVVATLNTLYTQQLHLNNELPQTFHFWQNLNRALLSIPENIQSLINEITNPGSANTDLTTVNHQVYGKMYTLFGSQTAAFAYLLFVLLYFPCVSATAAILRELNRGWTIFSVCWSTGLAYGVAVGFYQIATFKSHPFFSLGCLLGIFSCFSAVVISMKYYASRSNTRDSI